MTLSGYRAMWLVAMFDLPVTTRDARRQYTQFRKALLREGFSMLQYSVYARYCVSEETTQRHRRRLRALLPSDGQVRIMSITDRQFEKMEVYFGKNRAPVENVPPQLLLF